MTFRPRAELGHHALRLHVRQREEDHVGDGRQPLGIELVERQLGDPAQVRIHVAERLACETLRGHTREGNPRVREQEPQQLGTHVTAGAGDRDADVTHAAHPLSAWSTGTSGARPAARTSSARACAGRGSGAPPS